MPPNHFESEVESFLEGSHGDRTHIKRADHHTVTPLCGTLLQQLHVRLPRYRCTNKRCLQKIFRAGLACAPDNSKTTDQVTHWILQRLCLNRMSVAAAPKSLGLGWDMKCPRFCSV